MSEYIKHILTRVENKELSAKEAYSILYPLQRRTVVSGGTTLGNKEKCWYCGRIGQTNKDHFWPKSKGGVLRVYSCVNCNTDKAAKTPLQWAEYIEKKINAGTISLEKGNRIITATLSLWEKLERKPS